jgi:hypothetical protein
MSEGVLYKGLIFVLVSAIVEQHYLEWFIDSVDEE